MARLHKKCSSGAVLRVQHGCVLELTFVVHLHSNVKILLHEYAANTLFLANESAHCTEKAHFIAVVGPDDYASVRLPKIVYGYPRVGL